MNLLEKADAHLAGAGRRLREMFLRRQTAEQGQLAAEMQAHLHRIYVQGLGRPFAVSLEVETWVDVFRHEERWNAAAWGLESGYLSVRSAEFSFVSFEFTPNGSALFHVLTECGGG